MGNNEKEQISKRDLREFSGNSSILKLTELKKAETLHLIDIGDLIFARSS